MFVAIDKVTTYRADFGCSDKQRYDPKDIALTRPHAFQPINEKRPPNGGEVEVLEAPAYLLAGERLLYHGADAWAH
jgi:hypothetical protein